LELGKPARDVLPTRPLIEYRSLTSWPTAE